MYVSTLLARQRFTYAYVVYLFIFTTNMAIPNSMSQSLAQQQNARDF